jgi:glycerophosphoryl diester phosphodiesterase
MKILSHRGYWKEVAEKNTIEAMRRSFSLGFGTETDVRDYNGDLVISHDIADENAISFQKFLEIYGEYSKDLPLALNIKSDSLQLKLKEALARNKSRIIFFSTCRFPMLSAICAMK